MKNLETFLKVSGVLAIGVLAGVGLHISLADGPNALAQEKAAPGAEAQIRKLQIELPAVTKPTNTLVNAVRVGDLLYVSGTGPGPVKGLPSPVVGRLGQDLDVKQGRAVARSVGVQILAVVKAEVGSLDKVQRLVKTFGMVHATPEFREHPQVINGFSDLMVEVFGEENGKGARSAVGMASLPNGIPVEIEAIFQLRPASRTP